MASGASVKLGVDGISQFKNNINQAKQAMKTMDAQLSLSEKQFQKTGDAESYMTEKSELLKAKLEKQKTVVDNFNKALKDMQDQGVDRASKAYQDMYRSLLKAQGELIDTEQALQGVSENSEDAANNVSEMNQQLTNIGKQVSFETVVNGIDKITGAMEKGAKWAWKLGEALVRNVLGAGSYADELKTLSDQTDVDVETLQRMRYTAAVIDTDAETIFQAMKKLKKARAGEGEGVMGAFAAMNIDPAQFEKAEDLFWAVGEGLLKLGNEYEKEDYAQKLFGKSWTDLLPLFKTGREEYEKTMSEWNVVTQEQIESLGKMDDSNQKMQNEWKTFQTQVLAALSGPMKEILDTLTGLLQRFNEYLASPEGKEMLEAMGKAVSGLVQDLVNIDPEQVVEGLAGVFSTITDGFKWIDENRETVVDALKAIVIGWGLLELTGGALQIFQLISGIQGLTASSAAAAGTAAGTSWGAAFGSAVMKAVPWLAGLSVLTKNAFTPQGNDDLWDENGNPTALAKSLGITGTYDEYNKPGRKGKNTDYSLTGRTGSATANTPRMPNPEAVESTAPWIDLRWETMAKRIEDATENWSSFYLPFTRAGATSGVHMNASVNQEPVMYGGGGRHFGGQQDAASVLKEFSGLPAEMQTAVMTGVMRGMSNVTIVIDGPEMTSTIGAGMANRMLMATK